MVSIAVSHTHMTSTSCSYADGGILLTWILICLTQSVHISFLNLRTQVHLETLPRLSRWYTFLSFISPLLIIITLQAANLWTILSMFGYKNILGELNGNQIHRLENVLTLEHNLHDQFDRLNVWFEATVSYFPLSLLCSKPV